MLKRAQATFYGEGQGVGFRFKAESLAAAYKLNGYVRNVPDGNVEVVVEGEEGDINNFLSTLKEEMDNYIEKAATNWSPPTGEFKRFEIRLY
jgi:acylphosphatase